MLMIIVAASGFAASFAQATTRSDAPLAQSPLAGNALEMTRAQSPASELQCLEAFIDSRFEYAHRLCLILAQQGI